MYYLIFLRVETQLFLMKFIILFIFRNSLSRQGDDNIDNWPTALVNLVNKRGGRTWVSRKSSFRMLSCYPGQFHWKIFIMSLGYFNKCVKIKIHLNNTSTCRRHVPKYLWTWGVLTITQEPRFHPKNSNLFNVSSWCNKIYLLSKKNSQHNNLETQVKQNLLDSLSNLIEISHIPSPYAVLKYSTGWRMDPSVSEISI